MVNRFKLFVVVFSHVHHHCDKSSIGLTMIMLCFWTKVVAGKFFTVGVSVADIFDLY